MYYIKWLLPILILMVVITCIRLASDNQVPNIRGTAKAQG